MREMTDEESTKKFKNRQNRDNYILRTAHMNGISDAIFYGEKKHIGNIEELPVWYCQATLTEWYESGFRFGLHLKDELKQEFDIFALLDGEEIEDS